VTSGRRGDADARLHTQHSDVIGEGDPKRLDRFPDALAYRVCALQISVGQVKAISSPPYRAAESASRERSRSARATWLSWPGRALEARIEKESASSGNASVNAIATARPPPSETAVADRPDRTVTSIVPSLKAGNPSVIA
jgi:hypothetical protein